MEVFLTKSWLKVLSGFSINIAAALLAAPVIGNALSLARSTPEFIAIIFDIIFGIMLLLFAHWCEEILENE